MEPKTAKQINSQVTGQYDFIKSLPAFRQPPDPLTAKLLANVAGLERENARLERAMREAMKLLGQGNPHHAEIILAEALKEDE